MKLTNLFFIAAATLAVAASCSKEPSKVTPSAALVSNELTITAGSETKAYLDANGATPVMKWRNTDVLVVFDDELAGVELTTADANGATTATFTTTEWTGKTPKYAAAYCPNYGESRILTAPSDGVMSVKFRATLPIDNLNTSGFMSSAMVGKVEENAGAYTISEMKNVMGYLGFTLSKNTAKKVTVESIGGEPVSGWVDVDYAKLVANNPAFWTATTGKAQETKITLTPSTNAKTGNCFKAGTYYTSLLPQTYTQGLKITVYDESDAVIAEQTIGATAGITITRSEKVKVSSAIDIVKVNLPETVVIDLNFYNAASPETACNPFGFTDPGTANENATTGEQYTIPYNFTDSKTGQPASTEFTFTVCRSSSSAGATHYYYRYYTNNVFGNGYVLVFDNSSSWIGLPAIEGKYISSVEIRTGNGADKEFNFKTSASATSSLAIVKVTKGTETAPGSRTLHFYTDGNDGTNASLTGNTVEISTPYVLQCRSTGGTRLAGLTLTYTKTLPTR